MLQLVSAILEVLKAERPVPQDRPLAFLRLKQSATPTGLVIGSDRRLARLTPLRKLGSPFYFSRFPESRVLGDHAPVLDRQETSLTSLLLSRLPSLPP